MKIPQSGVAFRPAVTAVTKTDSVHQRSTCERARVRPGVDQFTGQHRSVLAGENDRTRSNSDPWLLWTVMA